ncbi:MULTISPECIES: ABC-type transport auxiliary lipoprotein family protein [unclassified Herbaspirillum]|uniref:ABC-type transport auxiliary lipoprotein family protein n=1 Tax=unclassified Herbaspirillum TaxID=2624150 RepID=UPI00114DA9AA|nr:MULTISPECIES: ABC-type transport auxiliary lipoprotein family protein [unclassified Herbaspirillum]MBB5391047.1 cholesterol transport system auxiliary component [Herbaspirillum sp. SJZ102]TQK13254.1 cholesterol transport system auxiliary component [Herbaspirillum sp. SJZ130]TQK15258.1 cholesterol transport system auxiliary component [Herbaspirillum sp. SJZ106]
MSLLSFRTLSAAWLLSLSAACSILPKSEPVAIYRLPALAAGQAVAAASTPAAPASQRSLKIITPYGGRAIDSERILVLPEGNLIQSYQGARWSDPAPVLLRNRLLQAFSADGRTRNLSTDDNNVAADLELGGDLVAFQTEYRNGAPVVVIQFNARMVDTASRRIIAVRSFNVSQPVAGTKVPEVVNAFGAASGALAAEILDWVTGAPGMHAKS